MTTRAVPRFLILVLISGVAYGQQHLRRLDSDSSGGGQYLWFLIFFVALPCIWIGCTKPANDYVTRTFTCTACRSQFNIVIPATQAITPEDLDSWVCARCMTSRVQQARRDQQTERSLAQQEKEARVAERILELQNATPGKVKLTRVNSTYYKVRRSLKRTSTTHVGGEGGGATSTTQPSMAFAEPHECRVCLDDEVPCDLVLLPCGHSGFCEDCCGEVVHKHEAKCPICREEIRMIARLRKRRGTVVTVAADDAKEAPSPPVTEEGAPTPDEGANRHRSSVYFAEVIPFGKKRDVEDSRTGPENV